MMERSLARFQTSPPKRISLQKFNCGGISSGIPTARLFAAGDTMLARWFHHEAYGGSAKKVFGGVLSAIQKADLAFVNLECVFSDRGSIVDKGERRPYSYRARPGMVRFLSKAGIDAVSQANNHAGDYGPLALSDSLAVLNDGRIRPVGAGLDAGDARRIRYLAAGETQTAWIAFDTTEDTFRAREGLPGVFYVNEKNIPETVIPLIREARKNADAVIVTPHWGPNWATEPTPQRRAVARRLIEAGADIILGHSSHVFNGMEIYKGRPIVYDMGSFLFDSVADARVRDSLYFEIVVSRLGVHGVTAVPISLNWRSVDLAGPAKAQEILETFIARSKKLNPDFPYAVTGGRIRVPAVPRLPPDARPQPKNPPASQAGETPFNFSRKPPCVLREVPPDADRSVGAEFQNGIRLLAARLPARVPQGVSFYASLYFSAESKIPPPPYEIRMILRPRDPSGPPASYHHEPGDWSYPTPEWEPGEIVEDKTLFRPPYVLPPGIYDAAISLFSIPDRGRAAPVSLAGKPQTAEVPIGRIEITPGGPGDRIEGLAAYGENAAESKLLQ